VKRLLITIVIPAVLFATGALWLKRDHFQKGASVSKSIGQMPQPSMSGGAAMSDAIHIVQHTSEVSDRDDVVKMRRMIEADNVAINFWGQVADQNGVPLPGVRVAYTYSIDHGNDFGVAWIEQEIRNGEAVTDTDGSFAITGLTGHDLTLESLSKPDYIYRMRFSLSYNFYGDTPKGKFEPRSDQPVRLMMIHKSATEPLIHVKGGLRVSGDGTPGRWNLWNGESDPNGELTVTLKRDPAVLERSGHLVWWSADLQIIGGGIIEAPWEEDVHRAPESGYSMTVAYPREQQKEGVPRRSFYVRTADNKYGRIQVELYAGDDGPSARCFVTCDMNPGAGSRNLEPAEDE
jgi:hypothetical protein